MWVTFYKEERPNFTQLSSTDVVMPTVCVLHPGVGWASHRDCLKVREHLLLYLWAAFGCVNTGKLDRIWAKEGMPRHILEVNAIEFNGA